MSETTATPAAVETTETTPVATETPSSGLKITRRGNEVVDDAPRETPLPESTSAPEATTPAVTDQATPTATTPAEEPEVDFFEYAKEQTKGIIQKPEDVIALYEETQRLRTQLAEKPKIEFPNEQAKLLYELSSKFPGQELAAARNYLHVMSLDVSKLSDKEAQFEAFALENKDLSREESRRYFEAKYNKNYGDDILKEDETAEFDHRIQTRKAKESLTKLQEDFSKLQPSQPAGFAVSDQEMAEIKSSVSEVLNQFGGVSYTFVDNDPNSTVNIPIDESDRQVLENYMANPKTFFEDLTNDCTENGNFSMEKLGVAMFEFKNRDKIREQAFKSGQTYGELRKVMELKNTKTPAAPAPKAPVSTAPTTYAGAFKQALQSKKVA